MPEQTNPTTTNQLYATSSEAASELARQGEIGYPVQVYYVELAKMYMKSIGWQWHPEVEIMIINHGEADFFTDDQPAMRLHAGEGVLINQNVMHSLRPVDEEANCSLYCVVFHPSFLFGYGNTVMSSKYLVPILSSPAMRIISLHEQDPWQARLLDTANSIIAATLTKRYGYELTVKSYLCQLWLILLQQIVPQNVSTTKQNTISLDESRVKEAILYIEAHYNEQITLDQLADSIHISKSECCRCFKRTLQITPIEYLMKYRIFKAVNMLQKNDPEIHSISTLAFSVGFNNASYFNKVFRQFLNCTPSEYRNMIKKDPTGNGAPFNIFTL